MAQPNFSFTRNSLLAALPPDDLARVGPHLVRVRLNKGDVLVRPNEPIDHLYFFETAVGSAVVTSLEGHQVEAGMIGREGVSCTALILESDRTPHEVVVQVEGDALCMDAEAFRMLKDGCAAFNSLMLRFAQTLQVQTSYTALSNATHTIEERLARWLLMAHDRSEDGEMALTHEFLSLMLAVRRPSVTTALHVLEGLNFIRASRGRIVIRDRRGLEDFARDAYGPPEAEYTRLIGPMPRGEDMVRSAARQAANQKRIDALEPALGLERGV